RDRMAPVIGHAGAVAAVVTAIIGRAFAIVVGRRRIVGGATVIAVIVVVAARVGGRDRNPGADDARKGGSGSRTTSAIVTPAIVAALGAEVGSAARPCRRRQALLLRGRRGDGRRRPDRGQHGRRDTGDHGRSAQMRNKTLIREHFHVLRGSWPDSRPASTNHHADIGFPNPNTS